MDKILKDHQNKFIIAGLSLPVLFFLAKNWNKLTTEGEKENETIQMEEEKKEQPEEEMEEEIEEEIVGLDILPANVRPKEYDLELTPNLETFESIGKVKIKIDIKEKTDSIVLNSKDIDFKGSDVTVTSGKDYVAKDVKFNKKKGRATLLFSSSLPLGEALLTINFTGTITDKLNGFYRSNYEKDGEKRWMGTTQFEPVHCREAFPCWDEPEIKAVFRITLNIPAGRTVLCNMPIIEETPITKDVTRVVFDKTPIMSTYLLAWVIGEFDHEETKTKNGTIVRVYTLEGKKEQGLFALDVAKKVLEFFTEYFDVAFPLPKLDMIAIPDFAAGAMENWGLVTYRETALLWSKESSAAAKERVAYVVAHELAHQWFGNLVSPSWWKFLWLNEGFATWAGTMAVDHLFPHWETWTKFVSQTVSNATAADSLESSHPVEVECQSAAQVLEIFDAISYYKGSSVIRMLADYLGEDKFRQGLRTYLKEKQFSCATTEDLWSHCSKASGQDVAAVMDNWIKKTGYPFITASVKASGTSSTIPLKLSQKRFLANGAQTKDDVIWYCPVKIIIGVEDKEGIKSPIEVTVILNQKEETFEIALPDGCTSDDKWWVKVNGCTSAFFRVLYHKSLTERLSRTVITKLNARDRLSIQTDVFALAQAGYACTPEAIKLASTYRDEKNYSVWSDLNTSVLTLLNYYVIEEKSYADLMKSFVAWLYGPIVDDVSWESTEGEEQSRTLLRPLVLGTLGGVGSEKVIAGAQERFKLHISGEKLIPNDLRASVFKLVLQHGGEEEYDTLVKLYHEAKMQNEKVDILRILGYSSKPEIMRKTIEFAFSENVRSQDAIYCFASVARNPKGKALAWDWLRENWDFIVEKFGEGGFMLPNFIKVTCAFGSMQRLKEINEFFNESRETPGADRAVKQVKEKVELIAKWIERDNDSVEEFLKTEFWKN